MKYIKLTIDHNNNKKKLFKLRTIRSMKCLFHSHSTKRKYCINQTYPTSSNNKFCNTQQFPITQETKKKQINQPLCETLLCNKLEMEIQKGIFSRDNIVSVCAFYVLKYIFFSLPLVFIDFCKLCSKFTFLSSFFLLVCYFILSSSYIMLYFH